METIEDIRDEFEKFVKEQKEIIEVGGCLNYVAISIWKDFLSDFFSKKYSVINKMIEKLNDLECKK